MKYDIDLSNHSMDMLVHFASHDRNKGLMPLTMAQVFDEVCLMFRQSPEMVKSKNRKRQYLFCRYIVAYVSYMLAGVTLEEIGDFLGKRDHSSIIESNRKVREWIKDKDPDFTMVWESYTQRSEIWRRYATK